MYHFTIKKTSHLPTAEIIRSTMGLTWEEEHFVVGENDEYVRLEAFYRGCMVGHEQCKEGWNVP